MRRPVGGAGGLFVPGGGGELALAAPLAAFSVGTQVGVPTGTSLTTRTSLGTRTGTGTYDLIDPTETNLASMGYAVDVWEAIDFTNAMNVDPTSGGTPRLFRNCKFSAAAAAEMVAGHNDTAGTVMTPLLIFDHCTWDGGGGSTRAINSGRCWFNACYITGVASGWSSGFSGVAMHCSFVTSGGAPGGPTRCQAVGGCYLWHNWLSCGTVGDQSPIRWYTEFSSISGNIAMWNGLNGGFENMYLGPGTSRNIAFRATDNVFIGGGTGEVTKDGAGTLTVTEWARNTIDIPGGVEVPSP